MTKAKSMPTAAHLDNPEGGPTEILLLEARIASLRQHGKDAMSVHDLRNGFTVKGTINFLTRQLEHMKTMTDVTAEPETAKEDNAPMGNTPKSEDPPGGGAVQDTLELLVEIRLARSLISSNLTEMKKRCKVKLTKLNLAETKLLDHYEEHNPQMTLFDLPAIPDDLRAILDNPTS